jgi:hypothetical protein
MSSHSIASAVVLSLSANQVVLMGFDTPIAAKKVQQLKTLRLSRGDLNLFDQSIHLCDAGAFYLGSVWIFLVGLDHGNRAAYGV